MTKSRVTDLRKAYPDLAPYRLVRHFGMDDLVYNHISARIPGSEEFLLNPMGLMYDEICASALIKVDLAGNVLSLAVGKPGTRRTMGLLEWPAMRRLADRLDPSCKN